MANRPVTVPALQRMKSAGERITMLTCYDASFARLLDAAEVDILLVGDSLGMVVQGHDHTLPVTLDEMIYHCRAVARGTRRAHILGDLPFMTYQRGPDAGLEAAGRLIKEGGAHAVKMEGGAWLAETVERCVRAGIPVMGHLGLTPQSVHAMGGFRVQGRGTDQAQRLVDDALALQDAGAYAVVLEGIPEALGRRVTQALAIPTIGIGAGRFTDGQVLVIYDVLGLVPDFKPKFVRRYADLGAAVTDAARAYCDDVRAGAFPAPDEVFDRDDGLQVVPAAEAH